MTAIFKVKNRLIDLIECGSIFASPVFIASLRWTIKGSTQGLMTSVTSLWPWCLFLRLLWIILIDCIQYTFVNGSRISEWVKIWIGNYSHWELWGKVSTIFGSNFMAVCSQTPLWWPFTFSLGPCGLKKASNLAIWINY